MTSLDSRSRARLHDAEDAAVVLTIVAALAASASPSGAKVPSGLSVWGDPGHRLGVRGPSAAGWWASGMPR